MIEQPGDGGVPAGRRISELIVGDAVEQADYFAGGRFQIKHVISLPWCPVYGNERQVCTLVVTYPFGYIQLMDAVLHALSDGHRRTVLEVLRDHPAAVGELADLLPIARPGVSRHLRVLREAGLVDTRHDAQWRIYSLRPEPLADVEAWLSPYRALWEQRLRALRTEIDRGKRERRSNP